MTQIKTFAYTADNTVPFTFDYDEAPPTIYVNANTIRDRCFRSQAEAEFFILAATWFTDDCTPAADVKGEIIHFESRCGISRAVIQATDLCGHKSTRTVEFDFDDRPPTIHASQYALASKWFTNEAFARNFFLTNTYVEDDCSARGDVAVSLTNFVEDGAASRVTITSVDKCGNAAEDTIMFLFDDTRPDVTLTTNIPTRRRLSVAAVNATDGEDVEIDVEQLGTWTRSTMAGGAKLELIDTAMTITATDAGTPNPNVTIIVYSDELYAKGVDDWTKRMVQLRRIEAIPGMVTGWKLLLGVDAFKKCNSGAYLCGGTSPVSGNGRVYTIQVCATDEAGNRRCVEKRIKVPTRVQSKHGIGERGVVDDGRLYVLAKDEVTKFGAL